MTSLRAHRNAGQKTLITIEIFNDVEVQISLYISSSRPWGWGKDFFIENGRGQGVFLLAKLLFQCFTRTFCHHEVLSLRQFITTTFCHHDFLSRENLSLRHLVTIAYTWLTSTLLRLISSKNDIYIVV